ncbi:MAG: hypothetical protein FIA89_00050 [Geobacter sp.]|nr:hypothetical protein [Geobacter sp.]
MTLDRDDILLLRQIIREEVQAAGNKDAQLQADYLVTLPVEERMRRAREQMKAERQQKKIKSGGAIL